MASGTGDSSSGHDAELDELLDSECLHAVFRHGSGFGPTDLHRCHFDSASFSFAAKYEGAGIGDLAVPETTRMWPNLARFAITHFNVSVNHLCVTHVNGDFPPCIFS